jgi:hypothetical protein
MQSKMLDYKMSVLNIPQVKKKEKDHSLKNLQRIVSL